MNPTKMRAAVADGSVNAAVISATKLENVISSWTIPIGTIGIARSLHAQNVLRPGLIALRCVGFYFWKFLLRHLYSNNSESRMPTESDSVRWI